MDETARALSDLSAIDDQLAGLNGGDLAAALVRRRGALRRTIPSVHLATYDAAGRIRRRPAVVAVRSSHCGGCHLRVPPQLESSLRRHRGLSPCPHCHRLLYVPGNAVESAGSGHDAAGSGEAKKRPSRAARSRRVAAAARGRRSDARSLDAAETRRTAERRADPTPVLALPLPR